MLLGTSSTASSRADRAPRTGLRRTLLCAALAATVALPLAVTGCGNDDSSDPDKPVELTVMWWGGEKRAGLTEEVLDLYTQKHPDVTFKKTWQSYQGYYEKLATLIAGNSAPDIFQIDDNYLTEYATKGVTLDLGEYKDSGKLDVSTFPESLWKYGEVKGKLSALALAENTQCLVYNKTALENAGQPEPKTGQSWEEHIAWAKAAGEATGLPGTMDPSADYKAFWLWLRDQGKDLYKGDELGFTADDVTAWFELWKGARDSGATPTSDVIHEGNSSSVTTQLVVTGKALTSWVWCNQLPELAKNTKDALGAIAYPGDPSGQWARASMYFAGSKSTKHKDTVIDVLNFVVNDPEAGEILGTERGLPSNLDIRKKIADTVTDANMKASIEIENELGKTFGDPPAVPIKGHSNVRSELVKAAEKVQFGQASPAKAAEEYIAAAKAAINK
ncbi:MAG: extracellular solute-binding protein [Dactylosporangium sp.]|nr:extracellular solute-binding protein [Dactylosporangium sp.]NNJ61640.1 extracellular solute-binding protein [Dactylosporangium sp.]